MSHVCMAHIPLTFTRCSLFLELILVFVCVYKGNLALGHEGFFEDYFWFSLFFWVVILTVHCISVSIVVRLSCEISC